MSPFWSTITKRRLIDNRAKRKIIKKKGRQKRKIDFQNTICFISPLSFLLLSLGCFTAEYSGEQKREMRRRRSYIIHHTTTQYINTTHCAMEHSATMQLTMYISTLQLLLVLLMVLVELKSPLSVRFPSNLLYPLCHSLSHWKAGHSPHHCAPTLQPSPLPLQRLQEPLHHLLKQSARKHPLPHSYCFRYCS